MRRLLVSLLWLGSCLPAHPQDVKPYLRIETVSHTAKVSRIDLDAAEQFLVSASDDKTARVWDLHSGKLLQILRPLEIDPQADSSFSHPLHVGLDVDQWEDSLSPTLNGNPIKLDPYEISRSLAIGPKQDSFVLGADWGIYRFDRQGAQIWRTSIPGVAWGINISSDGRYVVATLGDGTIRWYTYDKGEEVLALFVDRDMKSWVA